MTFCTWFESTFVLDHIFLGERAGKYIATDIISNEVIEAEHDMTHIETDHGMSHVEEVVDHHDFNEVTINSEEEVSHVILQVRCPTDKFSDITDYN